MIVTKYITVDVEVDIDDIEIDPEQVEEFTRLRDMVLKTIYDLSAIHYQHPEDYQHCNQCAQRWPCDHAQIIRELEYAVGVRG